LGNIPIANVDTTGTTSTIAYVTADELGTPRAIANSSGTTEWQNPYQSNTWSEAALTSTGYTYNLRFPGQYFDAETGFVHNIRRDYDPTTGRYLESDPIGLGGGVSTYAYVESNPMAYFDPLGLAPPPFSSVIPKENGVFTITGNALAGDIAYAVGTATGDQYLQQSALQGMQQDVSQSGGAEAVVGLLTYGDGGEDNSVGDLDSRVNDVQSALDPIAQTRRTTAGLDTAQGQRIMGAGGRDLNPAQRAALQPSEVAATCPGKHAEITVLNHAAANGLTPLNISASRPFCADCAATIQQSGGVITSPSTAQWPSH
jgi:RHS repeat-associated protein